MWVSWVPMWTHRAPSLLMPSPRTRNSGNAVCKKRIIPSIRGHRGLHVPAGQSLPTSNAGISPFRPTRIDCRTGRPKNSTHAGRITSDRFAPGTLRTCCRQPFPYRDYGRVARDSGTIPRCAANRLRTRSPLRVARLYGQLALASGGLLRGMSSPMCRGSRSGLR